MDDSENSASAQEGRKGQEAQEGIKSEMNTLSKIHKKS